jgi:hypothetical protein
MTGEKVGYKYPFAQYAAGPPLVYICISYISAPRDSQAYSLKQTTENRQHRTDKRQKTKEKRGK